MSCGSGNRFQCGVTRFKKHSFPPDKPSNQELHNENQKRLSELLKAREDIDKQFLTLNKQSETVNSENLHLKSTDKLEISSMTIFNRDEPTHNSVSNTNYTPWSTPQGGQYSAFNPK